MTRSLDPRSPAAKTAFTLAAVKCAYLRVRDIAGELDLIIVSLENCIINADQAMTWLHQIGCGHLIPEIPAPSLPASIPMPRKADVV